jgi:small subunit ribosomal protein S1
MAHDETFDERDLESGYLAEDDFAQLLDDHSHLAPPAEGEILHGHVVSVTQQGVIVDFGYKLEGFVPIEQFSDPQFRNPDGSFTLKRGDPIDVMSDRSGEQVEGYVLLSYNRPPACGFGTCWKRLCAPRPWSAAG